MPTISRTQAKAEGRKRYFTGRPCPRGHVCERFVSISACVDCAAEKAAEWKSRNPEKCRVARNEWAKANPERTAAIKRVAHQRNPAAQAKRSSRWYQANKGKALQAHYRWAEKNRPTVTAASARYRASKLRATPAWADPVAIAHFYEIAADLTSSTGVEHHVDHIIPLQGANVCGLHVETNLQVIPGQVNRSKGNRLLEACA